MPQDDPRPEPPERPSDDMCCGRGCMPCIFDYYEDALARYEAKLKAWQERHLPVPSSQSAREAYDDDANDDEDDA